MNDLVWVVVKSILRNEVTPLESENGSIDLEKLTELAENVIEAAGNEAKQLSEEERESYREEHDLDALQVAEETFPFQTARTPDGELLFVAPLADDLALTNFEVTLNPLGNLHVLFVYQDELGHLVEYEITKDQVDLINESDKVIPIGPERFEEIMEDREETD